MSRARAIKLGIIADTHGLYDPAVERHFTGVTEILHAGDIGEDKVIERYSVAVRPEDVTVVPVERVFE